MLKHQKKLIIQLQNENIQLKEHMKHKKSKSNSSSSTATKKRRPSSNSTGKIRYFEKKTHV